MLALLILIELYFCGQKISIFYIGCSASKMVSECFRLLHIIKLKIFQIGEFFRLASDWFQVGFRLEQTFSDCVFKFQIGLVASDCFILISNCQSEIIVFILPV